jgi:hypothetical protein
VTWRHLRALVTALVAVAAVATQIPAEALEPPAPPFTFTVSPKAAPRGNTFAVTGHCTDSTRVTVDVVRQARPGVAARIVQTRTATVDSETTGYSATFTNDLTTIPGFPVDAEVRGTCGRYTEHAPFVSTDLVDPNNDVHIVTLTAGGPCGTCNAHLKGFDGSAHLSLSYNWYGGSGPTGSIAAASPESGPYVVEGSGPGQPATVAASYGLIRPYGAFTGGVEVATGAVGGAPGLDIVTGAGPGGGPHVKTFTFDWSSGYKEAASFFAYDAAFGGGVRVAVGDVYGDEKPEIITAAGPGGGPHVRVFTAAGALISEFFAYAPNVTGGLSVAVGDVVPGGKEEIVTGAGPGGAAHVKTFNWLGQSFGNGFYAYDPAFSGGVWVAAGNVDDQGADEIVTGAGAGGMPHVRWFTSPDGAFTHPGFFAYEDLPTGVRAAAARD